MPIENFSELNGKYVNDGNYFENVLEIWGDNSDVDIVDFKFNNKDSVIITYQGVAGYKQIALKGKRKKNFFEVYLENRNIFAPPILVINTKNRLRIGKDHNHNLLIYKWGYRFGMLLILMAGSDDGEYKHSFARYGKNTKEQLYAVQIGDKWGYASENDSIVISPVYDFAAPFRYGRAKVSKNYKWGYINANNDEVIPLVYDIIMKPRDGLLRVSKNGKWGLIDTSNVEITKLKYDIPPAFRSDFRDSLFSELILVQEAGKIGYIDKSGVEIIPTEYDAIERRCAGRNGLLAYFRTRIGNKYGYASAKGVLCGAVFDKAWLCLAYSGNNTKNMDLVYKIGRYSEVVYKGEPFLFTEKGMLYRYKELGYLIAVDYESGVCIGVN